jgi:hypothetical protein
MYSCGLAKEATALAGQSENAGRCWRASSIVAGVLLSSAGRREIVYAIGAPKSLGGAT